MRNKLTINYYGMLSKILLLFILVGCFGYIRSLNTYFYIVNVMGVMLAYLIYMTYNFRKKIRKLPLIWNILWIYIAISVPFLNFPNSSRYLVVFSVGMFLIKLSTVSEDAFSKLPKLFSGMGLFFAIMTLFQAFTPDLFYSFLKIVQTESLYERTLSYSDRFGSYCGIAGESSFNAFCIVVGIISLIAEIYSTKKGKYIKSIIIGIMYYAVVLTDKRSFMLITPMIILCVFLMEALIRKRRKHVIICIILLILLPIAFQLFLGDLILKILADGKGTSANTLIDLSNREKFWGIARGMFQRSPIYGHGMMSYDNYYNIYFGKAYTFAGAHNSFIQLLAEMGCVGAGIYITAIVTTFFNTLKNTWQSIKSGNNNIKRLMYLSLSIQAMCIAYAWSGNPFHRPQQLVMYFIALGIATYAQSIKNEE